MSEPGAVATGFFSKGSASIPLATDVKAFACINEKAVLFRSAAFSLNGN